MFDGQNRLISRPFYKDQYEEKKIKLDRLINGFINIVNLTNIQVRSMVRLFNG